MKNTTLFSGFQLKWFATLAGVLCLFMATGASAIANSQPAAAASKEDSAKAATDTPAGENSRPCAEDLSRLCKDVQRGEGRMAKCIKEHEKELSPACKQNIAKMKEKVKNLKQSCEGDAQKLCKDVKPGGGMILKCLKQHEGELSPACREQMTHLREKKQ